MECGDWRVTGFSNMEEVIRRRKCNWIGHTLKSPADISQGTRSPMLPRISQQYALQHYSSSHKPLKS